MGVLGAAAIKNAIRVLQEERGTLMEMIPLAEMQAVWLGAAKEAIPYGEGVGGHTADTLRVARVGTAPGWRDIEIGGSKVARFLYTGTQPHVIQANHPAEALRFIWGDRYIFRERVNHPGTPPTVWREMAREIARPAEIELAGLGLTAWMLKLRGRLLS